MNQLFSATNFRPSLGIALLVLTSFSAHPAALPLIQDVRTDSAFPLVEEDAAAAIVVAANEDEVIHIAARILAGDIERVTGRMPTVAEKLEQVSGPVVLAGTVDHPDIQKLVADGVLDVASLNGEWESYSIQRVSSVAAGIDEALVVVGSDRRGAAYGLLAISRAIGVSPWEWWADVAPEERNNLYVVDSEVHDGPPAVRYRGIFINDEDWGLQPWAARTFEPETGDIGPKTYARIFELLLRLRANYVWPGMHPSTRAFNHYPENKLVADRYAIVMGSSHAEPMLRNNVDEWTADAREWNFETNRQGVLDYWEERVESNAPYENIWTVGMRGIHDSGMPGGGSLEDKAGRLEAIFETQRELLERHIGKPAEEIPQIFVPYKEVLEIYRTGVEVPDDVTIVWADDNHGYIRQLGDVSERERAGGGGVYYHLSYWGRPHDFLWLATVPPALIWEEMTKAIEFNADRVWIANVGDIKPAEIGLEWFMRIGWEGADAAKGSQTQFLTEFFAENFGDEHAAELASIFDEFYTLNFQRKPEHMDFSTAASDAPFAELLMNPAEMNARLEAFDRLEQLADDIGSMLPIDKQDAYFQLVSYPVRGAANMNRKVLYADMARRGMPGAAALAAAAYEQIQADTQHYNEEIADGKWNGIMDAAPRGLQVFTMPPTTIDPELEAWDEWANVRGESVIPIAAVDFSTRAGKASEWRSIQGLGRSGSAMAVFPRLTPALETPGEWRASAPVLEHSLRIREGMRAIAVRLEAIPTHENNGTYRLIAAIGIDGSDPIPVSFAQGNDENNSVWQQNVLRGMMAGAAQVDIPAGEHVLRVYGADSSVVLDRVVVELDDDG